jgi:hypothetical protein
MIDWTDFISERGRVRYAAYCPACSGKRYLPRYHARKDLDCRRCAGADNGRSWHLRNPSGPERNIMRQLEDMGIPYEREVRYLYYNLDFVIYGTHVIEVDGGRIHSELCDPQREQQRLEAIQKRYPLLVITDGNTKHCKRLIKEFLSDTKRDA